MQKPTLHIGQVLAWADAHHKRTGHWPRTDSGRVVESPDETWQNIDQALRKGLRGFPPDSGLSLARLLAEHRGVRNRKALPRYTRKQILAWADAHRRRTGKWPHATSGPIPEAPGETWAAVATALRNGQRGLPGGSSLPEFLSKHRRVRNRMALPRHTISRFSSGPTRTKGELAIGQPPNPVRSAERRERRGTPSTGRSGGATEV